MVLVTSSPIKVDVTFAAAMRTATSPRSSSCQSMQVHQHKQEKRKKSSNSR